MNEPASPSSTVAPQPLPPRLPIEASSARTVRIAGRDVLFFGGCGYLALAHEPRVLAALSAGAARYGVSSGAARETTGNVLEHEALEYEIASALEQEAALLLPEGACANLALCESLAAEFSVAFVDGDSHPSLRNAARANVAECRDFQHSELASLRSAVAAAGQI